MNMIGRRSSGLTPTEDLGEVLARRRVDRGARRCPNPWNRPPVTFATASANSFEGIDTRSACTDDMFLRRGLFELRQPFVYTRWRDSARRSPCEVMRIVVNDDAVVRRDDEPLAGIAEPRQVFERTFRPLYSPVHPGTGAQPLAAAARERPRCRYAMVPSVSAVTKCARVDPIGIAASISSTVFARSMAAGS